MPITQSRMISLIVAARAFERGMKATKSLIATARSNVASGANAAAELDELDSLVEPKYIVPEYAEHLANVALEERHFQRFAAHNDWRAKRLKAKRDPAAKPRKQTQRSLARWVSSDPSGQSPGTFRPAERLQQSTLDEANAAAAAAAQADDDPEETGGGLVFAPKLQRGTLSAEARKALDEEAGLLAGSADGEEAKEG